MKISAADVQMRICRRWGAGSKNGYFDQLDHTGISKKI